MAAHPVWQYVLLIIILLGTLALILGADIYIARDFIKNKMWRKPYKLGNVWLGFCYILVGAVLFALPNVATFKFDLFLTAVAWSYGALIMWLGFMSMFSKEEIDAYIIPVP